jgi:hypothetical protein
MASPNGKSQEIVPPSSAPVPANENSRARSIATRLTEAEFIEVEAAATDAGKKVAEWLREAALTHASSGQDEQTDRILLAEIMAMRALMLNLFAKASQGPLSTEDMRKMSAYSNSIKEQRQRSCLPKGVARRASRHRTTHHETVAHSGPISLAYCSDSCSGSVSSPAHIPGVD